ncbi:MAG: glycosyltransferase [Bacteroidaceae bacterium]|nr:glycosyltransferase [Bacteroidaceae bacterium]
MKISIITTTYNSASTVADTLRSVLAQTYKDIDYIVVDGASSDSTLDIIKEYEPKFGGRMRWVSGKDGGVYEAMNKGIRMAKGDVIGFLNSDDFYYDERVLEDINAAMDGQPVDCVYGDLKFVKADDTSCVVRIWKGSQYKKGAFRRGWHPAHPTFYARRECFERLGVFNTRFPVSADFDLMLRFIEVGGLRNLYVPRYFIMMRKGGESTGSLRNIIRGNLAIMRTLRENGYHTSPFIVMRRLLHKVWVTMQGRLRPAHVKNIEH